MPTTLVDLPTEIIDRILEDASLDTLFTLSFCCKFLRCIGLATYMRKCKIPCPEERIVVAIDSPTGRMGPKHDAFHVLCVSEFITTTRHLEISLPIAYNMVYPSSRLLGHIKRLVSRLALEEVILNFDRVDGPNWALTPRDALFWTINFATLLNTIIEKGCTSLKIEGLTSLVKDHGKGEGAFRELENISPTPTEALSSYSFSAFLKNIFKNPSERKTAEDMEMEKMWAALSPGENLLKQSKLTRLSLHYSNVLIQWPLLYWTQRVVGESPLTSLSIQRTRLFDPSPLPGADQDEAPPSLIVPKYRLFPDIEELELLNIGQYGVAQALRFLSMFPNLRRFTSEKDQIPLLPPPKYYRPPAELRGLFLPARFAHITHLRLGEGCFLASMDFSPNFLPALQQLTLIVNQFTMDNWAEGSKDPTGGVKGCYDFLSEISHMVDRKFVVIFEVSLPCGDTGSWMAKAAAHPKTRVYHHSQSCVSELGLTHGLRGRLLFSEDTIADSMGKLLSVYPPTLERIYIVAEVKGDLDGLESVERFAELVRPECLKKARRFEVNGEDWTSGVPEMRGIGQDFG